MYQAGTVRRTGDAPITEEMKKIHEDARFIIQRTIQDVLPVKAVRETLRELPLAEDICVIAIGKAAWGMAAEASRILGPRIRRGIVVTKYGHAQGEIPGFRIMESGHPMPDENSVAAAEAVLRMADEAEKEEVLLLLSGGGSALVEMPAPGLDLEEVKRVTDLLLKCGADIVEVNTVRKHLSSIKGGKLANRIWPAKGYAIILSDVVGNHPEMIASGMTYPDDTNASDVMRVIEKYRLDVGERVKNVLRESEKMPVDNIRNIVKGNVEELCRAAVIHAQEAGYEPFLHSASIKWEAKELGQWFVHMADKQLPLSHPIAIIAGGETVVRVTGEGLGGRNQEIALQAALGLRGRENIVLFSLASDGSDGPTDAAGGIVDGWTATRMQRCGIDPEDALLNNDSYHALKAAGGLIFTGPTGTNVNDVTVMLMRPAGG